MSWIVYILQCSDGTLYTGITNDLEKRLKKHSDGKGARYTRGRGPYEVLLSETYATRSEASKREAHIKSLKKHEKMAILSR